jgi:deoxyribodipyrimidine photo-lyase
MWFRADLRLADNPALAAAARTGAVVPVFIWAPEEEGNWPPGAASRWWLQASLRSLDGALRRTGSRLILARGRAADTLIRLAQQTGARVLFFNRRYEPAALVQEATVTAQARAAGIEVASFNSGLLFEPKQLTSSTGKPYRVFGHFWRAMLAAPEPEPPVPAPHELTAPARWPESVPLEQLRLESGDGLGAGLRCAWQPGEAGAAAALQRFLRRSLNGYESERDFPSSQATSRLSPCLHFGEISPRQIWRAVKRHPAADKPISGSGAQAFLRELAWREFAYHLLVHFPHTAEAPLREEFARFGWRNNARALEAWQHGRTGYPLVDAGMRELLATGWMHNRVRMIAASFLVKHLLLPWLAGARWFWERLVDADLASNTLNWQWVAGCGADAAPFFRIFNPVVQGRRFDPDGDYVRRWVPELARLPARWIHQPWAAPAAELRKAGVVLRKTYPRPVVDHAAARSRALTAFAAMRQSR